MDAPAIERGVVEQAIYTWSTINLSGKKGQGFAAVSPGLRGGVSWLSSLDPTWARVFDSAVASESEGYPGWNRQATLGCFLAGGLRIVYRKIASAGSDGVKRNRPLVHMLVAHPEELDLASIAADDPHWLTAESCPLDNPPKLKALDPGAFQPYRAEHDCEGVDAMARELLEGLTPVPHVLEKRFDSASASPEDLTAALLTAVPTALWGGIEIDWTVGREGPVVAVGMVEGAPGPPPASRADGAGLGACSLHSKVDRALGGLPPSQRRWGVFAAAFVSPPRAPAPVAGSGGLKAAPVPPVAGRPASAQLSAAIASAIEAESWSAAQPLGDVEAMRAMTALERLPTPSGGWLGEFSLEEARAVFGGIEDTSIARAVRFLDDSTAPTEDLVGVWRQTGLAAIGAALLERDLAWSEPSPWWAVPNRLDQLELQKLVGHLSRSEKGLDRLLILLRGGFLDDEGPRRAILAAVTAVDNRPKFLFETVLQRGELSPTALLLAIRQEFERFADWIGVEGGFRDALRDGLRPHRGPINRLIDQLRGGSDDGCEEEPRADPDPLRPQSRPGFGA